MVKIETGVDRLVDLVNSEKKISIDDAAKRLGISKVVVQEWADFLEEEKIISIEYQFSKTFLVERKLSVDEIKTKQKEFSSEKDAFVRKVETSLKNLESQTLGLEKIKNEFSLIKKEIGGELDKVKEEVKQLEKYEYLKKNLDKEIEDQVSEFHQILDKSHKEIDFEEKRHQSILQELDIAKREVEIKEHRLLNLEEKEKEIMKRVESIFQLSKELEKRVTVEKASIGSSENKIIDLEKRAREVESTIKKRNESLTPLLDKARKHEAQILKLQQDILEKAKEKTEVIKSKVEEGGKAVANFEKFFSKKTEVDTLIAEIEKERRELEDSFKSLEKRAIAFDAATKSNTVSTHVKDLEGELLKIGERQKKFRENLERLIKLVKG